MVALHHINADTNGYTVGGLAPFNRYAFFLIPFFRNIEGRPSNSKTETTAEAAPEGPPLDLVIRQLNSSSSLVKWSEPEADKQNGVITGYQVNFPVFSID